MMTTCKRVWTAFGDSSIIAKPGNMLQILAGVKGVQLVDFFFFFFGLFYDYCEYVQPDLQRVSNASIIRRITWGDNESILETGMKA